jgi:hypothetical protein
LAEIVAKRLQVRNRSVQPSDFGRDVLRMLLSLAIGGPNGAVGRADGLGETTVQISAKFAKSRFQTPANRSSIANYRISRAAP